MIDGNPGQGHRGDPLRVADGGADDPNGKTARPQAVEDLERCQGVWAHREVRLLGDQGGSPA